MAVTKEQRLGGSRRTSGDAVPPEGGWGWMVVAGCFLATICIRAVTRCVSMFFVEFQLHFDKDYSTTAWIHSLIDSTTMLCAPLGGFLASRLSCRATVMLGGLLSAAGLVLSSFASSLEYLYAFLGILTGSGIGTFVLAPVVQLLIENYSWRGALLILGGFVSNLCVCGALMRSPEPGGEGMSEDSLTDLERDCVATMADCKDAGRAPADCGRAAAPATQLEINNLKNTQGLLISRGMLKNIALGSDKPAERKLVLLSSPADMTIAECILFSNKLTESVLGEMKRSDSKFANGSTIEDMKLVESMILSSKSADKGVKMEDSGLTEAKETDVGHFGDAVSPRPPPPPLRPSSRGRCFGEEFGFLVAPDFLILSVAFLFLAYGCSAPVVYLVPYALSVGVEHQHAAFLVSIFGVSGILGNITFGWITDRKCLKRYRMLSFMLAIGMEGLCCMFIPLLHSFSLLVPFAVLYGYFDGAYVVLIPVVTSDIVGSTNLPSGLGVVYFLHAIPYLISPPIGGWLVDVTGNYVATFFLSGACFMCSSVVLIATMLVRRCRRSKSDLAAHLYPHLSAAEAAADRQGII
ncbi:monocarboxylate transporter 12-B isoform X2 [Scophthalmus maximus]|uniref:Solute carrier family 16 member 12a n=1 Tax=Scophthalmus maximus TaxID=52904 RepID=A0A8D3BD19_SCOMX|nr:monocarboxylate transporter 12-B isoform X2 [Scophthalmus maximus]